MPVVDIEDVDDPRVAGFRGLTRERWPESIAVEGHIAVERALGSRYPVAELLTTPAGYERLRDRVARPVCVWRAPPGVLRTIVGFDFHRGCIARMPRPAPPSAAELATALSSTGLVLIAEGLADPANLGAAIRNAAAFGAGAVLSAGGADPWSRRAIRAAMGLGFGLPILHTDGLPTVVAQLRATTGARVAAAVLRPESITLWDYRPRWGTIVLVGNEGAGLSPEMLAMADDAVTIPLSPGVDSLNVAAATAVLLWSLRSHVGDRGPRP